MSLFRTSSRIAQSSLAAGVLLTNGCTLTHASLPYAKVTPAQYCPGDAITAEYDAVGSQPCVSHTGVDCATLTPTVVIASDSASLPAASITAFTGSRMFMPTGSAVTVTFNATPADLIYPARNSAGENIFARRDLRPITRTITRIDGEVAETLTHNGMCAGTNPVNAPSPLPGAPRLSTRLVAQRICNTNAVPIIVNITGAPGAPGASATLSPSECLPLGFPADGGVVNVAPAAIAPGDPCGSTQTDGPPQTLTTRVFLSCG